MPGATYVVERKRSALLPALLRALWPGRREAAAFEAPVWDAFGVSRLVPRLVAREDGAPRCVGCNLCAFACPTHCLEVVAKEDDSGARAPARFTLALPACLHCGLCEEACPEEALVMGDRPRHPGDDAERLGLGALSISLEDAAPRLATLHSEVARRDTLAQRSGSRGERA